MGEIRFVGTRETRGYPYLVCKKKVSHGVLAVGTGGVGGGGGGGGNRREREKCRQV